jgi:hypothetical protein
MKKVLLSIACFGLLVLAGCGESDSSHSSYSHSSTPYEGYYVQTALSVDGEPEKEFVPEYMWVGETAQIFHYKRYDSSAYSYSHRQENFAEHTERHHGGSHHSEGDHCYNISYEEFQTYEVGSDGKAVSSTFHRTTKERYEAM